MIVAVVGSRNYPHLDEVRDYVRKIADKYPDAVIVSGGARGVDQAAEQAAREAGLGVISYRPFSYMSAQGGEEWSIETVTHPENRRSDRRINSPYFATFSGAAFRRNTWIVKDSEVVVAFTTGSSGTGNTIKKARRMGRKLVVHEQAAEKSEKVYIYTWGNNERRVDLKGRKCVIEAKGAKRTVLVRFLDTGERVTTSERALRIAT